MKPADPKPTAPKPLSPSQRAGQRGAMLREANKDTGRADAKLRRFE